MAANFYLAIGFDSSEKVIFVRFRVKISEIACHVTSSSFDVVIVIRTFDPCSELNIAKRVSSARRCVAFEIAFRRNASAVNGNLADGVILGNFLVVVFIIVVLVSSIDDDEGSERLV